jgi:hypothetical protein
VAKADSFWPLTMEVSVGFVVDKIALGQVLRVTPVNFISPLFHTHSFFYHRRYTLKAIKCVVKNHSKK